jgi:hypothetical protein
MSNRGVNHEQLNRRIELFDEAMQAYVDAPWTEAVEPEFQALNQASLAAAEKHPSYSALKKRYLASEEVVNPSYWVNKWDKAHQFVLVDESVRKETQYPNFFDEYEVCLDAIERYLTQPGSPTVEQFKRALDWPLQVNRRYRAAALGFAMGNHKLHDTRIGEWTVHEYGYAGGQVLNSYALGKIEPIQLVDDSGKPNVRQTAMFNAIARLAPFDHGVGVDLKLPKTTEDEEWVKACTLTPNEFDRDSLVSLEESEFDVIAQQPSAVTLVEGDIYNLDTEQARILTTRKADGTFSSHLTPDKVHSTEKVLEAYGPYSKARALHVFNGYYTTDPRNPHVLIPHVNWYSEPWLCITAVLDAANPDKGFIPIMQWRTSSCQIGRVLVEGMSEFSPTMAAVLPRPRE